MCGRAGVRCYGGSGGVSRDCGRLSDLFHKVQTFHKVHQTDCSSSGRSCFGQDVSSLYGRSFWLLAFSGASFFCGGVSCGIDRHIHGPSNPIHLDARTLKKLNEAGKCPASKTWVILERGTGICSSCGQSFSAKCGRKCMAGCHFLCITCYQRALSRPTVVFVQMFISYVSPGRQQPSGQFRKGARAPRK